MDLQTLGFALTAGLVAALNPCGFSMLPAYLALVVVGDGEQRGRGAAVGRALGATAVMALGFLVVFGTFGLLIAPLTSSVQQYLPVVTVLIGAAMIGLGIWMLTGRELTVLLPKPHRGAPTAQLSSMFGYGLAYAIASLSCTIGPFLAVTSTTFRSGSILGGVLAYLAYGAGMTIVVGVLATAVALAGAGRVRRWWGAARVHPVLRFGAGRVAPTRRRDRRTVERTQPASRHGRVDCAAAVRCYCRPGTSTRRDEPTTQVARPRACDSGLISVVWVWVWVWVWVSLVVWGWIG